MVLFHAHMHISNYTKLSLPKLVNTVISMLQYSMQKCSCFEMREKEFSQKRSLRKFVWAKMSMGKVILVFDVRETNCNVIHISEDQ